MMEMDQGKLPFCYFLSCFPYSTRLLLTHSRANCNSLYDHVEPDILSAANLCCWLCLSLMKQNILFWFQNVKKLDGLGQLLAVKWDIIWHDTVLLTWPPLHSWFAKMIKWLVILPCLCCIQHCCLPSAKSGCLAVLLYRRHVMMDRIIDCLATFFKHFHSSHLLQVQLKGGLHSGMPASLYVSLWVLWDRMIQRGCR